jgi:hypothetical protein
MTPQIMPKKGLGFCGMLTLRSQNVPERIIITPQHQEGLMALAGPVDCHVDTHVTPSTESIVCIYYENLFKKVVWEVECKGKFPDLKPPHDRKNARWCTKWSDAKIGQSTFGGWKPEALTKFSTLTNAITHARTLKRTKMADKWLLKDIRDRHNHVEKGQKPKKVKFWHLQFPQPKL